MKMHSTKLGGLAFALSVAAAMGALAAVVTLNALTPRPAEAHAEQESQFDAILKRGKLLAGVRFDYPPMGYVDKDGKNIGFGPDLAREFAKHLGVQVEFVQVTSKNRFPLLISGAIDADIGPTTPEKPREEVVDFSYTYVWEGDSIMVRAGMSKDPADYFKSDKIVGAIQGSNFIQMWKDRAPNANFKLYQEYPDLAIALTQGKVDVALIGEITAHALLEKLGDGAKGVVVGGAYNYSPQSIGLRQNDSKWRNWVNWALQRLWAEGTFQKLYKQHFKMEPPFHIWENGHLQPRVMEIGSKERDKW